MIDEKTFKKFLEKLLNNCPALKDITIDKKELLINKTYENLNQSGVLDSLADEDYKSPDIHKRLTFALVATYTNILKPESELKFNFMVLFQPYIDKKYRFSEVEKQNNVNSLELQLRSLLKELDEMDPPEFGPKPTMQELVDTFVTDDAGNKVSDLGSVVPSNQPGERILTLSEALISSMTQVIENIERKEDSLESSTKLIEEPRSSAPRPKPPGTLSGG